MKIEGAVVFLISLFHLRGVNGRSNINIEISAKQQVGAIDSHGDLPDHLLSSEDIENIYDGPFNNKIWGDKRCRYIRRTDPENCMRLCRETEDCTAVNLNNETCELRACPWLQYRHPKTKRTGWKAYNLNAAIFVEYDNNWSIDQCPNYYGYPDVNKLSECKLLCIKRPDCTAISFSQDLFVCILLACGWPVPTPQGNEALFKGYALAPVCYTASKCGIIGGFCIATNEICNGETINEEGYCSKPNANIGCKCCLQTTVYMRDIENSIAYGLKNRVPYKSGEYRQLNQAKQTAVSNFIVALISYLPISTELKIFLDCLKNALDGETETISGEYLVNTIYSDCENAGGILPRIREGIGCRNTENEVMYRTRSYPCGLWTIFHSITVNPEFVKSEDPNSLLRTILNLAVDFRWCSMCKANFIKKYYGKETGIPPAADQTTAEDVTMWLWLSHNDVTKGNKENQTNPGRSQLQYPGVRQCPDCRFQNGDFDEPKVLSFLREVYKPEAIVFEYND